MQKTTTGRLDYERSQEIAAAIDIRLKQCWRNAMLTIMVYDTLVDAFYVQGYIVVAWGAVIAHGWVELADGTVIDPTLVFLDTRYPSVYPNQMARRTCYFPVKRWSRKECEAIWDKPLPLPLCTQDDLLLDQQVQNQAYQHSLIVLKWLESHLFSEDDQQRGKQ